MRLSESIEKKGFFWLPNNSENRLQGILRISKTGESSLEVIGTFDESNFNTSNSQKYIRIFGFVENGELVTLDRCFYTNITTYGGGLSKSTYFVNFAFLGAHYDENKPITFSKTVFSIEGLDEWLSISGIRKELSFKENKFAIYFTLPKSLVFTITNEIKLTFVFTYNNSISITDAKVSQKANISLESDTLRPLNDFLSLVSKIRYFFCFAIDEMAPLEYVSGFSKEFKRKLPNGEDYETPIKMYFRSSLESDSKLNLNWYNMLFRFNTVSTEFEKYLKNWILNYDISEPAFNLFFASKGGAYEFLDGIFLSLVQGIETLHRRNFQDTEMPESEFTKLSTDILYHCPEEKKEWLKGKLKYANEVPLRRRINKMIEPFQHLFGNKDNRDSFVSKVVNTRNYLTHYDSSLESQCVQGIELWKINRKLEALFQLNFLRIIGFNIENIEKRVNDNKSLREKLEI